MGCWSIDNFGNDDAADWLLELAGTRDASLLRSTVAEASGSIDPLGAAEAARLLAAAEVVAASLGRPGAAAKEEPELSAWIERVRPDVDDAFVIETVKAVSRVLEPECGLRRRWENADRLDEWLDEIADLLMRLRPGNASRPKPRRGKT